MCDAQYALLALSVNDECHGPLTTGPLDGARKLGLGVGVWSSVLRELVLILILGIVRTSCVLGGPLGVCAGIPGPCSPQPPQTCP